MGNIQAAPEKFLDPLVSTYVRVCAVCGVFSTNV